MMETTATAQSVDEVTCPACNGNKKFHETTCLLCGGIGTISRECDEILAKFRKGPLRNLAEDWDRPNYSLEKEFSNEAKRVG